MISVLALDRNHRDTGMFCQYREVARSLNTRVRTSGVTGGPPPLLRTLLRGKSAAAAISTKIIDGTALCSLLIAVG